MDKITSIDGQRIMGVLQEMCERVELLSLVTAPVLQLPLEKQRELFGDEVADVLNAQRHAEQTFSELMAEREMKRLGNISSRISTVRSTRSANISPEDATHALRGTTIKLLRVLKGKPDVVDKLVSLQQGALGRSAPLTSFIETLRELKDVSYQRLLCTVEEEKSKEDFLSDIMVREQKAQAELKKLQTKLAEMRHEREAEVAQRIDIINKLKDEIQDLNTNLSVETKILEKETKATETNDQREFHEKFNAKKDEQQKLEVELEQKTSADKTKEQALRKQKFKVEKEVENWVQTYDEDMEAKVAEIREIQEQYAREKEELREMELLYTTLAREREDLLAEVQKIEEERRQALLEEIRKHDAASTIQRFWRRILAQRIAAKKAAAKRRKKKKKAKARSGSISLRSSTGSLSMGRRGSVASTSTSDSTNSPKIARRNSQSKIQLSASSSSVSGDRGSGSVRVRRRADSISGVLPAIEDGDLRKAVFNRKRANTISASERDAVVESARTAEVPGKRDESEKEQLSSDTSKGADIPPLKASSEAVGSPKGQILKANGASLPEIQKSSGKKSGRAKTP